MVEEINTNLDTTPLPPNDLVAQDPQSAELAGYVRTKTFGRDVRESIARSIELNSTRSKNAEELANETLAVTETATSNMANQVELIKAEKDAVIANATVDSEVILARGGKATLGQRLDETTTQLAQTKQLLKTAHIIEYSPLIEDYGALVNTFTSANSYKVIKFHPGHVYPVKTTIKTGMNHIDFNWSTIESHVENGFAIEMQARDSLSNLILNKKEGIVGNGILVKSRDHIVNGLISRNQKFNIFFKFEDAWDCQFNSIRVDMDVEGKTGTFIVSDHSVNNQFNNLNIAYGGLFAHFTAIRHPEKKYGSEGWFFNNTSVLMFKNGILGDLITHLSLTPTFMFDLSTGWFAKLTLGNSFRMTGCWIASNFTETDSRLITITPDFGSRVSITENSLINTGAKENIEAFSVSGQRIIQNNNIVKMNGGDAFGNGVYGNIYSDGYEKSLSERKRETTIEGSSVINIAERNQPFEITVYEKNVDNGFLILKGIYRSELASPTVSQISNTSGGGLVLSGKNNLGNIVIGGYTTEANLVSKLVYTNL